MVDQPRSSREWRLELLALGALAVLGLAAYAGSLGASFHLDDRVFTERSTLRNLGAFLAGGWRERPTRAVAYLTFALNYALTGPGVLGFHLTNLLVHLLNGWLVYALVRLTFRTPLVARSALTPQARRVALVAAALFVAHPLQTQAVTYLAQRFTSLATTFYLGSIAAWARWRLGPGGARAPRLGGAPWYAASVLAAVLAMKSKEIAFTLPVVVALYEILFFGPLAGRRVLHGLPLLAAAALVPLGFLSLDKGAAEVVSDVGRITSVQTQLSRLDYLATELPVVATYLRLLVLPAGQNVDHDPSLFHSFAAPRVAASGALLLGLLGLALWLRRQAASGRLDPAARLLSFGILWFFAALSVESTLIPIVDVLFEHRVYLPSVGFFAAVAVALALLARRVAPRRAEAAFGLAGLALALVLGALTFARNEVWATEVSLWSDAARKSPDKARPHYNLALALAAEGRAAEAIPEFLADVRLNPSHAPAYEDLALAYAARGELGEAERWLRADLQRAPERAEAHAALGALLLSASRPAEAIGPLARAVELQPSSARAIANLGGALNQLRRFDEAARVLSGAFDVVRESPEARFNLGVALAALGNRSGAAGEAAALDRLSPELASRLRAFIGP